MNGRVFGNKHWPTGAWIFLVLRPRGIAPTVKNRTRCSSLPIRCRSCRGSANTSTPACGGRACSLAGWEAAAGRLAISSHRWEAVPITQLLESLPRVRGSERKRRCATFSSAATKQFHVQTSPPGGDSHREPCAPLRKDPLGEERTTGPSVIFPVPPGARNCVVTGPRGPHNLMLCPQLPGHHRAGYLRRGHLAHREHWRDHRPSSGPPAGQEHDQKGKVSDRFPNVMVLSAEVWPPDGEGGQGLSFPWSRRGFSTTPMGVSGEGPWEGPPGDQW